MLLGVLDTGPLLMVLHAMMISTLLFPPAFSTCVNSSPNPYRDAQGLDLAWSGLVWSGLLTVGLGIVSSLQGGQMKAHFFTRPKTLDTVEMINFAFNTIRVLSR